MQLEVIPDAQSVAQAAARVIAGAARASTSARGRFVLAVSGGHAPWMMLRALADEDLPWAHVDLFQVDERIAPSGDPDRNLTHMQESLLQYAPLRPEQIHAMPVDAADLRAAAYQYDSAMREVMGSPPEFDLVHLGLGADGHTASLVPGDAVLDIGDQDIAVTGVYDGRRRMTLTYPTLNRARQILWVVTGSDKQQALRRLIKADQSIPAARVQREHALLLADRDAGANAVCLCRVQMIP
jgi:6-phosphogluconolactonase